MSDIIDKSEIIHELDNYEKGKGSWVYSEINGVKTKVYTKYLTGTTAAAASTSFNHGISDYLKILKVAVAIKHTSNYFYVYDYRLDSLLNNAYKLGYGINTINLWSIGVNLRSKPYRVEITYYE